MRRRPPIEWLMLAALAVLVVQEVTGVRWLLYPYSGLLAISLLLMSREGKR